MISFDTNVLYALMDSRSPFQPTARQLFEGLVGNSSVVIAEQTLMELYCLLRNPAVSSRPLSSAEAVAVVQTFRSNPAWRIVDIPPERDLMERIWARAAKRDFAYRRIFDVRLSETLLHHGVTLFYTRNVKDFQDSGLERVVNPFAS